MNKRPQRGAARVSAVWMIVVVVLFFVALAFGYVANEDAAKAADARDAAQAAATKAAEERDAAREEVINVSKSLGFYDRERVGAAADPAVATQGISELSAVFPNFGPDVKDFQQTIPILKAAYAARLQEIATLESRIKDLQGQVTQANQAASSIKDAKDKELAELRQQLTDEQDKAGAEKTALQRQVDERTQSRNQVDGELRTARGQIDDLSREQELKDEAAKTRMANLTSRLKFEKEPEAADGKVLEYSKALGLGWIDRGARNRVIRGMKFRVDSGNPASPRYKGELEVISVKEDMSEVVVVAVADPFDPIVAGDVISNPLYDPEGGLKAVLVGRFSGTYNERELELLLRDVGIEVQPKVDLTTTHMIVGNELYADEEGEPLEEPMQPSETGKYKDAVELGVNVVSINDVRRFFKK